MLPPGYLHVFGLLIRDTGDSLADLMGALVGQSVRTDENGSFAIDHVPPGDYAVLARGTRAGEAPPPEAASTSTNVLTMMTSMFGGGGSAGTGAKPFS